MTEEQLIDNGYRRYAAGFLREHAVCLYQKPIEDGNGTKYFINVYPYDFENIPGRYECEVHFSKGSDVITVTLHNGLNVNHIETFFEDMWKNNGFDYNDRAS